MSYIVYMLPSLTVMHLMALAVVVILARRWWPRGSPASHAHLTIGEAVVVLLAVTPGLALVILGVVYAEGGGVLIGAAITLGMVCGAALGRLKSLRSPHTTTPARRALSMLAGVALSLPWVFALLIVPPGQVPSRQAQFLDEHGALFAEGAVTINGRAVREGMAHADVVKLLGHPRDARELDGGFLVVSYVSKDNEEFNLAFSRADGRLLGIQRIRPPE